MKKELSEKIYKTFYEKNSIKRYIFRKLFNFFQSMGFYVIADHFYEIIPNTKLIEKTYKNKPRDYTNLNFSFNTAERFIISLINRWGKEFYNISKKSGYFEKNNYFHGVDAITLYCFLRNLKPKRVIEIGQGISTSVIIASLVQNYKDNNQVTEFISLDPYKRFEITKKDIEGVKFKFINKPLQITELDLFSSLKESDFLFIDSSHVYKFGSDVEYLFEKIYPILHFGVYIHLHDIFSPYHYPLDWYIKEKRFWNEQYYLENFLSFNDSYKILLPIYYLIRESILLREKCRIICNYNNFKFQGSSFYIKKIK